MNEYLPDLVEYCRNRGFHIVSFHAGSKYSISIHVEGKMVTRIAGSYIGLTQRIMEATNA